MVMDILYTKLSPLIYWPDREYMQLLAYVSNDPPPSLQVPSGIVKIENLLSLPQEVTDD